MHDLLQGKGGYATYLKMGSMDYKTEKTLNYQIADDMDSYNAAVNDIFLYGGNYAQDVSLTGDPEIDYLLMGVSWGGNTGQGVTITYNWDWTFTDPSKQALMLEAMSYWEEVANITFQEVSSNGDITMKIEPPAGQSYLGYAQLSTNGSQITHVNMVMVDGNMGYGNYKYTTMIHELGHSIGLKHPHSSGPGGQAPGNVMNPDHSVLSYSSYNGYSTWINRGEYTKAGYADAKAAAYLYGSATATESGDTVYNFSNAIPTVGVLTDTGGVDTFYLGGYSNSQTVNLGTGGPNSGDINMVGASGNRSKFFINENTVIENAMGGSGNDLIIGNDANNFLYGGHGEDDLQGGNGNDSLIGGNDVADAQDGKDKIRGGNGDDVIFGNAGDDSLWGGQQDIDPNETGNDIIYGGAGNDRIVGNGGNDTLIGGSGQDYLYGGAGNDKFFIGWGNEADIIIGFEGAGVAGGDQIRILANVNNTGIQTAADLAARMTTDGTHTWLNLSNAQGVGGGVLIAWHTPDDFDLTQNSATSDFFVTSDLFA